MHHCFENSMLNWLMSFLLEDPKISYTRCGLADPADFVVEVVDVQLLNC